MLLQLTLTVKLIQIYIDRHLILLTDLDFIVFFLYFGFCKEKKREVGGLKHFSRPLKSLSASDAGAVVPNGYKISEDVEATNQEREPMAGMLSLGPGPPRQEGNPSTGVWPGSVCNLLD